MRIALKILCREQFSDLPDGSYEVPDGVCAAEALAFCAGLPLTSAVNVMFMRNGKHVQPDAALSDGDSLLVLRPLRGG